MGCLTPAHCPAAAQYADMDHPPTDPKTGAIQSVTQRDWPDLYSQVSDELKKPVTQVTKSRDDEEVDDEEVGSDGSDDEEIGAGCCPKKSKKLQAKKRCAAVILPVQGVGRESQDGVDEETTLVRRQET